MKKLMLARAVTLGLLLAVPLEQAGAETLRVETNTALSESKTLDKLSVKGADLTANNYDLTITTSTETNLSVEDGKIEGAGSITSAAGLWLDKSAQISAESLIVSGGRSNGISVNGASQLEITNGIETAALAVNGTASSLRANNIDAASVRNSGRISVSNTFAVNDGVENSGSLKAASITANALTNNKEIEAGKLNINGELKLQSGSTLNITSTDEKSSAGKITNIGGTLTAEAGTVESKGEIWNARGGTITVKELSAAGKISNVTDGGSGASITAAALSAAELENDGASLNVADNAQITGAVTNKNNGSIAVKDISAASIGNSASFTATGSTAADRFTNSGGTASLNDITVNRMDVTGGAATISGTVGFTGNNAQIVNKAELYFSSGAADLSEGKLNNFGSIKKSADENLSSLKAASLYNENTALAVDGDIVSTGNIHNFTGTLSAKSIEVLNEGDSFFNYGGSNLQAEEIKAGSFVNGHETIKPDSENTAQVGTVTVKKLKNTGAGGMEITESAVSELLENNGTFTAASLTVTNGYDGRNEDNDFTNDNSSFNVEKLNIKDGGSFTFASKNEAQVGSLASGDAQLNITEGSRVHIDEIAQETKASFNVESTEAAQVTVGNNLSSDITVTGTSAITDGFGNDVQDGMQRLADTFRADTGKEVAVVAPAGTVLGQVTGRTDGQGRITVSSEYVNQFNQGISEMASISLMAWRQENNDINKRLGELRDSSGEHGVWVRMTRGEAKYGAQNVKNQYNSYQLGYDEKLSVDKSWTVGAALTYTDAESSFADGKGENKHKGFAVYGSKLNKDGSFIDLIAKYARLEQEFEVAGGAGKGDYNANGYSVSAEYGKRFTKDNGLWIEPQAELTYGRIGSADYVTNQGVRVRQEGMDSVVARLGFAAGKSFKQGNAYVRASYLYDFVGETDVTFNKSGVQRGFEQDLGSGWWEVGIGTNLNFSKAAHFYLDVEKTYGGNVATPWQWNAGLRWSF